MVIRAPLHFKFNSARSFLAQYVQIYVGKCFSTEIKVKIDHQGATEINPFDSNLNDGDGKLNNLCNPI